jgi:hypothetical protein
MTEPNEREYEITGEDKIYCPMAHAIARYRLELTAERDKTIERLELEIEQRKNVDRLRVEQLRMQMFEVHDSRAEAERLRAVIEDYADRKNWEDDNDGVYRKWLEPESSTRDRYDGWDLAVKALASVPIDTSAKL